MNDRAVYHHLRTIRARQRHVSALRCAVWGLLLGAMAAVVTGLTRGLHLGPRADWLAWSMLAMGPAAGWLLGLVWPRDWHEAARAVDRHCGLKDRAATALEFAARSGAGPWHALQLADAVAHLHHVDARQVVPLRAIRALPWALLTSVAAIVLLVWPTASASVNAGPAEPLDFVVAQAERVAEQLRELEEFASREQDPEIEQLVAQLRELTAELKQPGVGAREALAKLSAMPAALQQQQAEFNVAQVEAQLQAVGEALSLAAATAQAGKALAAGEMSQARHEKLTGQMGDEGDTETETIQSPESEQAAQRAYREKYLEYQKLSEAVLDSEPIPLGHRQTIRRYFQAIRPEQETPPPSRP